MDYDTLIGPRTAEGSIKYFVQHHDVPSEFILDRAQSMIYSLLRVREMVTRSEGTIATDAVSLAMPTGMLHPLLLLRRGLYKGEIAILDQEHFESRIGEDESNALYPGTPSQCTFDSTTFYFDVKADQDYPYRLWHVATPALLSASNTTNFLTTRYSHILEAACKAYAFEHRATVAAGEDGAGWAAKAAAWLEKATAFVAKANEEFDMFNQSIRMEAYWSRN